MKWANAIPENEVGLPLVKAIKQSTGRQVHLSTALRWCQKSNRYGIRLQSWMIGGRRVTSVEAVKRFNEATTAASSGYLPSSSTRQRAAAHRSATDELDREFGPVARR